MQVVYHLGVHCTDEDRLLKCLLKNRGLLAKSGIIVPAPSRYRTIFRETMAQLRGKPAEPELQTVMLDAMIDEDRAERLIFSHEFFISSPSRAVQPEGFYASTYRKIGALANLFPQAQCEFHISLRNPATLIPALLDRADGLNYETLMGHQDPTGLRWGPVIARAVRDNPNAKITVWANEDTPFIWSDVLRAMARVDAQDPWEGEYDFLSSLMTADGVELLTKRLAEAAPRTPAARRALVMEMLTGFAAPDATDMPIDLPGWTENTVDVMTAAYETDLKAISQMSGVTFIAP